MEKVTFRELDPEDLHTCQHCQHSYHDIVNGKQCEFYGHIPTLNYIRPNDCGAYKSPYLSDYRRRPDMEKQIKKQQTQKQLIMKANELMIGDWVCYDGDVRYSMPVKIEGMDIYTGSLITSDREDVGFDGIIPIPLTAEILEKNGFEELESEGKRVAEMFGRKPHLTGVWQYGFGRFDSVSYIPELKKLYIKFMEGGTTELSNIRYVHELQHALRLCGVEKEIVL